MRSLRTQRMLPVALGLAGLIQLIYGAGFHSAPVLSEQEILRPPPAMPMPAPGLPFFEAPPPPPPTPEKVLVSALEPELRLIREVTIGGLARLADGELKRTYTGTPPSLCPT